MLSTGLWWRGDFWVSFVSRRLHVRLFVGGEQSAVFAVRLEAVRTTGCLLSCSVAWLDICCSSASLSLVSGTLCYVALLHKFLPNQSTGGEVFCNILLERALRWRVSAPSTTRPPSRASAVLSWRPGWDGLGPPPSKRWFDTWLRYLFTSLPPLPPP